MTREELNKYVEMGDIKNDEEITTERAIAEVHRWIRVVEGESYEYENLTPKVLDMVIRALSTVSERLPEVIIKDKNGKESYALYDKSRMLLFTGMMTVDCAKYIGLEIIESEETNGKNINNNL